MRKAGLIIALVLLFSPCAHAQKINQTDEYQLYRSQIRAPSHEGPDDGYEFYLSQMRAPSQEEPVDEFELFQAELRAKEKKREAEQAAIENRKLPEKLLSFSDPEEAVLLKDNFAKLASKIETEGLEIEDLDKITSEVCAPYLGLYRDPGMWFSMCKEIADKEITREDLKRKATKGDVDAQFELGMQYNCIGLAGQFPAVKWLKMAAQQGDVDAQYHLARVYSEGIGMKSDFESAYFWASLALKGVTKQPPADGNEQHKQKDIQGAKGLKDHASSRISDEARAVVQKRIDAWKPISNVSIPPRRNEGNSRRFLGCPGFCGTGTSYDGP